MTVKNPKPLTRPRKGEPNHGKYCAQPGSLPVSDLPMQPSLGELLREPKSEDVVRKHDDAMSPSAIFWRHEAERLARENVDPIIEKQMQQDSPATMVKIHCPLCGWQQEVEWGMWASASSKGGHGHTCGSGKCPSHTYMALGEAPATMVNPPAVAFDHHSCILCDHVIVQEILGNKCKISGALCCNLKSCPIDVSADKRSKANEMLSSLKKMYRNEQAILDYIEMIECEIMALEENKGCTLP